MQHLIEEQVVAVVQLQQVKILLDHNQMVVMVVMVEQEQQQVLQVHQ